MPILLNDDDTWFPSADYADENGIVAVGGRLNVERLYKAYQSGIFPWPHEGLPLLWFCPNPRFVLKPKDVIVSRSLKKALMQTQLRISADTDFLSVITNCEAANRKHQDGTWITSEVVEAYHELFQCGLAHSIEAYHDDQLVGGLYGVSLGGIFFGESMFFHMTNASKICFITLVAHLVEWGFSLIDCQAHTNHLATFGARPMLRPDFLRLIEHNHQIPTKYGPWQLHLTPAEAYSVLR